jgi:hypothetical protein
MKRNWLDLVTRIIVFSASAYAVFMIVRWFVEWLIQ